MRTNYMMTVDDVMEELGVKRSKAYSILKQLNDELAKEGYVAVRGRFHVPTGKQNFMDALREQYEGGFKMSAYKDKTQGTWYVSFRYIDWTGKKIQKLKRGFKTKKEALNYEKEFIRKTAADMKMEMNSFIQVYFEDKKNELKENSIRNKQHMMNKHIVPYFGTRKMNEITPAEIIQWQNTIQEKGYSKTYERMIQNQLNALFNHAQKIYNLKENPCKKVKKMGKSDANKLEFWTKAEYDRFIAGIEPESEDYLIFEILFWTGIREGELLALSLSDFDMSGNLLHINKTYNRIRKRDVIDTPKTENSVRTIDIPNFLKEEVQEYAKKHYGFPEDQRLFPIVARTLQKRLKKYEALTGVKPIRVHDIRHSHVAYLIYQGVEPLIIKERLGHKDIQMTLNTYGHLYPSQQKKVAEMLDNKR